MARPLKPYPTLAHREPAVARAMHTVMMAAYRGEAALLGVTNFPPLRLTPEDLRASAFRWIGREGEAVLALEESETTLSIAYLAVAPARQRRGIGERLVTQVLEESERRPVIVATAVANRPAIALYERLGFRAHRRFTTPEGIACVELLHEKNRAARGPPE